MSKILLITYKNKQTMKVAKLLQDTNYEVKILNCNPRKKIESEIGIDVYNKAYFPPTKSWISKIMAFLNNIPFYFQTYGLLKVDILLAMDNMTLRPLKLIKRMGNKTPFIVFMDIKPTNNALLKKARKIILPDDQLLDSYRNFKNRSIVPYGVEFENLPKNKCKTSLFVQKLIEDEKTKIILTKYTTKDDFYRLIAITPFLKHKLIVISTTRLIDRLRSKLITALKLEDKITFVGSKNTDIIYSASDIYYSSNKYDPFTILAMKHKLPIINPNVDTLPELQELINSTKSKKMEYNIDYTWETFIEKITKLI